MSFFSGTSGKSRSLRHAERVVGRAASRCRWQMKRGGQRLPQHEKYRATARRIFRCCKGVDSYCPCHSKNGLNTVFKPFFLYLSADLTRSAFSARIKLSENVKIKKYEVYGLKIQKNTLNARFHDHFKDSVVPAMFINPKDKNKRLWDIHIIDKAAIPNDLVEDGTAFSIEYLGKTRGNGTFYSSMN